MAEMCLLSTQKKINIRTEPKTAIASGDAHVEYRANSNKYREYQPLEILSRLNKLPSLVSFTHLLAKDDAYLENARKMAED